MEDILSELKGPSSDDLLRQFDQHVYTYLTEKLNRNADLSDKLQLISEANHTLFTHLIKKINTSDHFQSSFWRVVNIFSPTIVELQEDISQRNLYSNIAIRMGKGRNILWLIKGTFNLAHMDIVKNYLNGYMSKGCSSNESYYVIFIDSAIDLNA